MITSTETGILYFTLFAFGRRCFVLARPPSARRSVAAGYAIHAIASRPRRLAPCTSGPVRAGFSETRSHRELNRPRPSWSQCDRDQRPIRHAEARQIAAHRAEIRISV